MRPTLLGGPAIFFKHLEHGDFLSGERVASDGLAANAWKLIAGQVMHAHLRRSR